MSKSNGITFFGPEPSLATMSADDAARDDWLEDELSEATKASPGAPVAANCSATADQTPPATSEEVPTTWAQMRDMLGKVEFDWEGWLAKGWLAVVAGDAGVGKSNLALRIAQTFLQGTKWPDGTPYTGDLGKVLWCETEGSQQLNAERAVNWALPMDGILTPLPDPTEDVRLDWPEHRAAIAREARRADVRLIVVDSLSSGHRRKENDLHVTEVVKWLANLAKETRKPLLLIHHLRKRGRADGPSLVTLEDLRGHSSIGQVPRLVWALEVPDTRYPERKRLSVIKTNLGRMPKPLMVMIDDHGVHFREWVGEDSTGPVRSPSQLERAIELLNGLLAQEARSANEIREKAQQAGISWDTMERAKRQLGVISTKDGKGAQWYWEKQGKEKGPM